MRVLFVVALPFLMEPLGVMTLIAQTRRRGHNADLLLLRKNKLLPAVLRFQPDVIAYSSTSADIALFSQEDRKLTAWFQRYNRKIPFRIMGGAHPTFYPAVLNELNLDAICIGEGDLAFPTLLDALSSGSFPKVIPNIVIKGQNAKPVLELVPNLDEIPFPDRKIFYTIMPLAVKTGLRSFMTSRGCPYQCTYCFNHAYNKMFSGHGPILRRRSVENVIEEIRKTAQDFPGMRFIRFADDTFCHHADHWLEQFAEHYRREIGVPFYCLMRSNTLTEETARLLSEAGCVSVGMSIEAGDEQIRNTILKRNISDELLMESFAIARKYGIKTYASTMVGIPGTSIDRDYYSLDFVRKVSPTATIFNICTPYYGTRLWEYCREKDFIEPTNLPTTRISQTPPLKCFSTSEQQQHRRMGSLGPLYCHAPSPIHLLVKFIIQKNIPLLDPICYAMGRAYTTYRIATRIFWHSLPQTPWLAIRLLVFAIRRMT